MRIGFWAAVSMLLACNGDKEKPTDTGADADTDTDTDSDTDSDADTDQPQGGQVRFAHASEPFGNAGLWVDGSSAAVLTVDPLTATPWRQLPAGNHNFGISAEGAVFDPNTDPKVDVPVAPGGRYTLVLVGPPGGAVLVGSPDDNTGLPNGGTRYNILNAAIGLTTLDVRDATDEVSMAADLAFGTATIYDVGNVDREVWVDVDNDDVWDLSYQVPAPPTPNTVVPLIFTYQGTELMLLAYSPTATLLPIAPVDLGGEDTAATDATTDDTDTETADTAPPDPPETADTGGDTGTATDGTITPTGDTGP